MELRWCGRLPLKQYGFFRGVCPEARGIYAPRCSSQSGGWFFRLDYRIKGCFAVFRKAVCRYGHNPWKNRESLSLAVLSYRFAKGFAQIIRKSFVKAGYYYGRVWNAWQGDWKKPYVHDVREKSALRSFYVLFIREEDKSYAAALLKRRKPVASILKLELCRLRVRTNRRKKNGCKDR